MDIVLSSGKRACCSLRAALTLARIDAEFSDGVRLYGTFEFEGEKLVFTFSDETVAVPEADEAGNWTYSITTKNGYSVEFVLSADFVRDARQKME